MPIGTWELVIIFLAVLLLFGGKKIPEIARGLGKGMREFKRAANDIQRELDLSRLDDDITKKPKQEISETSKDETSGEQAPVTKEIEVTPQVPIDDVHDPGPEVETEEEKIKQQKASNPPAPDTEQTNNKHTDTTENSES